MATLTRVEEPSLVQTIGASAGKAALEGGANAAKVTAVVSGVQNLMAWKDGRVSGEEAVKETAKATVHAAIDGGAKSAAGTALKLGARAVAESSKGALKTAAGRLAGSNAVFAVGAVAVDAVSGGVQLLNGSISGEEFAKKVGSSGTAAAGGFAGAEAGAALGTMICPGLGTVAGGFIGGVLGSIGASSLLSSLWD